MARQSTAVKLHEAGLSDFKSALDNLEQAAALHRENAETAYDASAALFAEADHHSEQANDAEAVAARLRDLVTP